MLKVYKNTLLICTGIEAIAVVISVLCEVNTFSYSGIIQDYSIGIACSLLVVSITTLVQYVYEHHRAFRQYMVSLKRMFRIMNRTMLKFKSGEELSNLELLELNAKLLEVTSDAYEKTIELSWFNINKVRQHKKVTRELERIVRLYHKGMEETIGKAMDNLFGSEELTELYELAVELTDIDRDKIDLYRLRDEYWGMLDYDEEE